MKTLMVSPVLAQVLKSAARLQEVVPDAVLVGGSAAAMYAGHPDSFGHDHVLVDLVDRYEAILDAAEATDGWATSVRASRPPFTIMGQLGGIEAAADRQAESRWSPHHSGSTARDRSACRLHAVMHAACENVHSRP